MLLLYVPPIELIYPLSLPASMCRAVSTRSSNIVCTVLNVYVREGNVVANVNNVQAPQATLLMSWRRRRMKKMQSEVGVRDAKASESF